MKIVKKHDPDRVMYRWPGNRRFGPKIIDYQDDFVYYEWVYGDHPHSVTPGLYDTLEQMWGPVNRAVPPHCVQAYLSYCVKIGMPEGEANSAYKILFNHCALALCVHGDCTAENIVYDGDKYVLIDPGNPRGLYCRELDQAKLMQSWIGWNWGVATRGEFPWRSPQVYALCITHFYRLIRHKELHDDERIEFARDAIKKLWKAIDILY